MLHVGSAVERDRWLWNSQYSGSRPDLLPLLPLRLRAPTYNKRALPGVGVDLDVVALLHACPCTCFEGVCAAPATSSAAASPPLHEPQQILPFAYFPLHVMPAQLICCCAAPAITCFLQLPHSSVCYISCLRKRSACILFMCSAAAAALRRGSRRSGVPAAGGAGAQCDARALVLVRAAARHRAGARVHVRFVYVKQWWRFGSGTWCLLGCM